MTQDNNEELITMMKPNIPALLRLKKSVKNDKEIDKESYKNERLQYIETENRIEISSEKYNKLIFKLLDLLEADYKDELFDYEEYQDEKETFEALVFKSTKPVEALDGYNDEDIKYNPKTSITKHFVSSPKKRISVYNRLGMSYLMKKTSESTTFIVGNFKYIHSHSSNFPVSKLFLFIHVKKNALKWLESRGSFRLPPQHEVTVYNYDYEHERGEVVGTDLDHAYWRIARNEGIITNSTYDHGLDPKCKALRLATISVLGRERSFRQYKEGKPIRKVILKKADERLQGIFKFIRFHCYQMMQELSRMLGDDFDCYQTDCIYYRNTPENVKKVHNYFNNRNLLYKQLAD